MTATNLPTGCVLADEVSEEIVLGYGYQHWTVADVISMLQDHDPDARVWIVDEYGDGETPIVIRPLESLYGSGGEVFL